MSRGLEIIEDEELVKAKQREARNGVCFACGKPLLVCSAIYCYAEGMVCEWCFTETSRPAKTSVNENPAIVMVLKETHDSTKNP